MTRQEFYLNAALYAMQGMQEGSNISSYASDVLPSVTARLAFRFADAMLEEFDKREEKINKLEK